MFQKIPAGEDQQPPPHMLPLKTRQDKIHEMGSYVTSKKGGNPQEHSPPPYDKTWNQISKLSPHTSIKKKSSKQKKKAKQTLIIFPTPQSQHPHRIAPSTPPRCSPAYPPSIPIIPKLPTVVNTPIITIRHSTFAPTCIYLAYITPANLPVPTGTRVRYSTAHYHTYPEPFFNKKKINKKNKQPFHKPINTKHKVLLQHKHSTAQHSKAKQEYTERGRKKKKKEKKKRKKKKKRK